MKTHEFYSNLLAQDINIIGLTETWLSSSVLDAELFDARYTVFRKDRQTRGGGVAMAVQSRHLSASKRMTELESDGEDLWVKITFKRTVIFVCVVYFPPNSSEEHYSNFFQKLEGSTNIVKDKYVLILGDFNYPSSNCSKSELNYFLSFFELQQLNHVKNDKNRILDNIYGIYKLKSLHYPCQETRFSSGN
jgi:exonuclease III